VTIVAAGSPSLFAFVSQPSASDWPIVAIFFAALLLGEWISRMLASRR
jgi:hypothetical protein